MPLHLDAFVGQNLTFSHQISVQLKTSEHFRAHFFVFRAQFLTKRRHFRPDPFLSCAERWQDLRAVRDSRGPCSEKGPFLARSPRGVFPNGGLQGYLDTRRANLAKTTSFWIHGGDVLPLRGVISVRGLLENTWRSFIAMVRHCRMHCAPFDSRLARRCSARRQQGTRRWRRGCWGRSGQRQ